MAFSHSALLQALGWATLNSFWQMALLWCLYLAVSHFTKPSSNQKYLLAAYSVFTGAAWFLFTLFSFYNNGQTRFESLQLASFKDLEALPMVLSSASITYLVLLIVPTYKVIRNWRFLQTIKKQGLQKASVKDRLFVQKISGHIGIKRNVQVFLSQLVTSPVTIGYLKPIILIPVAALGNLTPAQLEAILLHELSHIKRYDYLVNLALTAVHVLLYFNPFVKLFMKAVEAERENCCDELVLQFEYDRVSYASALLQLEKANNHIPELAMGATNKNNLLCRIERIVGIKRKTKLNASHLLGAFGALLLLLMINSMIIASKNKVVSKEALSYFSEPYAYFINQSHRDVLEPSHDANPVKAQQRMMANRKTTNGLSKTEPENVGYYAFQPNEPITEPSMVNPAFQNVAFDEVEGSLTEDQKAQVKTTLDKTKKALQSNWMEVERSVPDGLLTKEKAAVKNDYLQQIEQINWQHMEQSMKAGYDKIDWDGATTTLNQQLAIAKLDSIRVCYEVALTELHKVKTGSCKTEVLPIPDASVTELRKAQQQIKQNLIEINNIRNRKVIKL